MNHGLNERVIRRSAIQDVANDVLLPITIHQQDILFHSPDEHRSRLDAIEQLWLTAKSGGSVHTKRVYHDVMKGFRTWLQERGLDLDSNVFRLAEEARAWVGRDNPARSTFNHRLGILSSFYQYAYRHQLLRCENPIAFLERLPVPPYADAKALDFADIQRRLAAIDRTTLQGKRDVAFLVTALFTGRRKSELMNLRMGDLEWSGERLTLIWRRCKGGKVMRDTLATFPKRVLLEYLHALYGPDLPQVAPDAAVWASIARHNYGLPLHATALYRICWMRLGITSIHQLRHTFAHAMEEAGAKVTDIQARLGHNNLATTSLYLAALSRDENPHADALASLFGIQEMLAEPVPVSTNLCVVCGQEFAGSAQADPRRRYCSHECLKASRRKDSQGTLLRDQQDTREDQVEPLGEDTDCAEQSFVQQPLL